MYDKKAYSKQILIYPYLKDEACFETRIIKLRLIELEAKGEEQLIKSQLAI